MISRKVVPDKYNSGTGTQKSMVFHAAGQVQASYLGSRSRMDGMHSVHHDDVRHDDARGMHSVHGRHSILDQKDQLCEEWSLLTQTPRSWGRGSCSGAS